MIRELFIILCVWTTIANGQVIHDYQKPSHIKDSLLVNFVGKWEWRSDSSILTVVFKSTKMSFSRLKVTKDLIVGWHSYIEQGRFIESTMEMMGSYTESMQDSIALKVTSILGTTKDANKLTFIMKDLTRKRDFSVSLQIIEGQPKVAIWKSFYQHRSPFEDTTVIYPKYRTVPTDIVLRKIE